MVDLMSPAGLANALNGPHMQGATLYLPLRNIIDSRTGDAEDEQDSDT